MILKALHMWTENITLFFCKLFLQHVIKKALDIILTSGQVTLKKEMFNWVASITLYWHSELYSDNLIGRKRII